MKCADCKQEFSLGQITFKPDGRVPGLIMPKYKAQCRDCMKKIPIDDTSKQGDEYEYTF